MHARAATRQGAKAVTLALFGAPHSESTGLLSDHADDAAWRPLKLTTPTRRPVRPGTTTAQAWGRRSVSRPAHARAHLAGTGLRRPRR